jgi:hypothetical protein
VASAYGALINNAKKLEGRYSTIFDDGYFKEMLQSVTLPLGSWSYRWTYGCD